jgi:arylsulfatase A
MRQTTPLSFRITALLLAPLATLNAAALPGKPNILFILTDDEGLSDVGCYGSDRFKGKTPNIDALAATGVRFTHGFAPPLCRPSRTTLNTGRYLFRNGALTNTSSHIPSAKDEPSLARTLKQAGYATGMAGKWRQMKDTPGDWGFDEWLTDPSGTGWFWEKSYIKNGQTIETPEPVYCPDVCMEFTLDFLRRHREQPFYFYFPTHLVHGQIHRTPDSKPDTKRFYNDDIAYADKQVGQLVAELDKLGLRENTLIVFSGDNGSVHPDKINGRMIDGHKHTLLEGGSRVPLIANWKGTTPAGKVVDDLVDFSDFFATFAELASAKMPKGVTFDSHSFAPQLRGERGTPREWVFVQLGAEWYAREPGFKLMHNGELFDMSDAPFAQKAVPAESASADAKVARVRLQAVLDKLSPAFGKTDSSKLKKGKGAKAKETPKTKIK